LFAAAARAAPVPRAIAAGDAVIAALSELNPDDMSPREALEGTRSVVFAQACGEQDGRVTDWWMANR